MIKRIIKKIINKMRYVEKIPVHIPIMSGNLLENKIVLITGGTKGIGFAIAECCIRNGAKVIITGRDEQRIKNACDKLNDGSNYEVCRGIAMDMNDIDQIEAKLKKAINLFEENRIDALVNNAGIMVGDYIGDTTKDDFEQVMRVNLESVYFLAQAFGNYLVKNNIKGNILNISSSSGRRPAVSPYMVSKWGEVGLTKGLAKKLIKNEIVVNGLAPGPTATEMLNKNGNNINHATSPSGRYCMPEEIANMAICLISSIGRMIVGETVFMTGGSANLTLDDINY